MSFSSSEIRPAFETRLGSSEWVPTIRRGRGALRYRCPVTGSYVLLTDPVGLARLAASPTAVRCAGCGAIHRLAVDDSLSDIVRPSTTA
jgi:hypothetical protein